MSLLDRRRFLGAGIGTFAAAGTLPLFAQDSPKEDDKKTEGKKEEKPFPIVPPAPHETVFVTWQRDPTTTMTVQWISRNDKAFQPHVSYRILNEGIWQNASAVARQYPMTDLLVHRVELTGLKPGAEYQFMIGSDPRTFRFRTMPAKATDAFHFVTGGDSGIGEHAIANNKIAARQDPMFALIAGDLAYENGREPGVFLQFIRNYSAHMVDGQGRLIPFLGCLGNHEVNGGYGQPREKAPFFFAMFDGLFRDHSYAVLDFGDYLSLVLLDTGHISPIDGEQTSWLRETLKKRVDCPHLFVANHVPAYPSFRRFEDDENGAAGTGAGNRKHWVPLFEKYNVDVVLEHHDHTFKRTHPLRNGHADKNGIIYLGDGSWGKLRSPKSPEERPYLAVTHKAYHLTLHRLEGDRRFHMAIEDSGRIIDICTTSKRPLHAPPA